MAIFFTTWEENKSKGIKQKPRKATIQKKKKLDSVINQRSVKLTYHEEEEEEQDRFQKQRPELQSLSLSLLKMKEAKDFVFSFLFFSLNPILREKRKNKFSLSSGLFIRTLKSCRNGDFNLKPERKKWF